MSGKENPVVGKNMFELEQRLTSELHTLKDRVKINGFRPGMGQYLPDRFFWTRNSNMDADDGSDD